MRLKITPLIFVAGLLHYGSIQAQCNATFQEVNGYASIEAEDLPNKPSSWQVRNYSNASGGRALFYNGSNYFGNPGAASGTEISFTVRINNPGTYAFIWRNAVGIGNEGTEHNDSWLKIEADEYYAVKGGSRIVPVGGGSGPFPKGSSGDGFFKLFKAGGIDFNFSTFTSDFEAYAIRADFDSAGTYTMRIRGRSNGHVIDRLVLYRVGSVSTNAAEDISRPTTRCSGDNSGGGSGDGGSGDGGGSDGGSDNGGDTGGDSSVQAEINSVQLLNADTDNVIQTLTNGQTIGVDNLASQELGIIANTTPEEGVNVTMKLTGPLNVTRTESSAPFSLFGDVGNDISGSVFPPGDYRLEVSTNGDSEVINFSLVEEESSGGGGGGSDSGAEGSGGDGTGDGGSDTGGDEQTQMEAEITAIQLIDAETDNVLETLSNGTAVEIQDISSRELGIMVLTDPVEGVNVTIKLTGPVSATTTESAVPFSLFGDIGTDVQGRVLPAGEYTLEVTTFGDSETLSFTLASEAGDQGDSGSESEGDTSGDPADGDTGDDSSDEGGNEDEEGETEVERIEFHLYDGSTKEKLMNITEGAEVPLDMANGVYIVVELSNPSVQAVAMELQGPLSFKKIDNAAPFSVFGDLRGKFLSGALIPGLYTITATGFEGSGESAVEAVSFSVNFRVLDPAAKTVTRTAVDEDR